jgi:primosomal protein N' (replication factor Y)
MNIVRVALDVPLPRLFDYLASDSDESDIGRRVDVPFGKGSKTGIIVGLSTDSEQPENKLKPVAAILRDMPALPPDWLALCEFCARYYQTPLGEVTSFALPPMLRRGKLPRMPKATPIAVSPAPTSMDTVRGRRRQRHRPGTCRAAGFVAGATGGGLPRLPPRASSRPSCCMG